MNTGERYTKVLLSDAHKVFRGTTGGRTVPFKLKFAWKEVQAGIWRLQSPSWHHGVIVWHRTERLYWWHPANISAPLDGPWLTLAVAQVAVENRLRGTIVGSDPRTTKEPTTP